MNFNIDVAKLLETLPIIGKAMLGIFAVTIVIILLMYLLNKLTENRE